MGSRRKARILALQALFGWDMNPVDPADLILFKWLDETVLASFDEATLSFARLIIIGTLENLEAIDAEITGHLKRWDFSRLAKVDLAIIRMSAYALIYQPDIPPSVTIDEAIDIAKVYGADESYRFVNGVLDGIRKSRTA